MGATADINPLLFTRPERFTPVYQTSNADGNIGAAGAFATGVWWIERGRLHCIIEIVFGAGFALGTGEILAPVPNGYVANHDEMADAGGGFFLFDATATKQLGAANTVAFVNLLSGGGVTLLAGLRAGLAGAIAGDAFTASYSFPIQSILPDPVTTQGG